MVKAATGRTTTHERFTIERTYDASPAEVFAAWADAEAKRVWFCSDEWKNEHTLDFRVGGREWIRMTSRDGDDEYTCNAEYHDIVPDERIVYSYTMDHKDRRLSASLTTIELRPSGDKTLLVLTEADVFLDGKPDPSGYSGGLKRSLDSLGDHLKSRDGR